MQLDPKHLMLLAEIFDAGGFTEAAQSLATSQPGLSRLVKNMESRLGEPLFIRARKPLQLTPIGRRLVEQGRAIRTATKRAVESAERIRSGEEGELRIGGTPFFLDGFISSLIAEFQAERANVSIQLSHGYPDELIQQVLGDQLDVAICPVDEINPEMDLSFVPLIKGHNVVACRTGHPLRSKKSLTAKDLLSYPWVAPPPHSPLHDDLRNARLAIEANHIQVAASGGGLGSVVNYIVHTDCLTILPYTVVFALRRQGAVSALPFELNHPSRTLGLVRANTSASAALTEKFTTYLENRIALMMGQIEQHESVVMQSQQPGQKEKRMQ